MPLLTCPNCNLGMQEVRRNEVLMDVCSQCRGVWLDRGELEKILQLGQQANEGWRREKYSDSERYPDKHYQKQKKSWIFELFD